MEYQSIALFYRPHIGAEALEAALKNMPTIDFVGYMSSEEGTLDFLAQKKPDLLVLDLALPQNGESSSLPRFTHLEQYREHMPCVDLVVVSEQQHEIYGARALKLGAMAYERASAGTAAVVKAIDTVISGNVYSPADVTTYVLNNLAQKGNKKGLDTLSPREIEVFSIMGKGLPPRMIADKLGLSTKTVGSYAKRVRQKLGIGNMAELRYAAVSFAMYERIDVPSE